jgi:hypothetical protein
MFFVVSILATAFWWEGGIGQSGGQGSREAGQQLVASVAVISVCNEYTTTSQAQLQSAARRETRGYAGLPNRSLHQGTVPLNLL